MVNLLRGILYIIYRFLSTVGIEHIIGGLVGYSRVDQPLLLLPSGCDTNADAISDMELSATIQHKTNLKK